MSRTILLESLPIPPSTHTSLLLKRLSIGCLLNIALLYLRLPYWCTSSTKVVVHNILNLFLNQGVCNTWRSHTLPHHYINSTNHFGLSFVHNAPNISNELPDHIHSASPLHSFRKKLKTHFFTKAYPPLFLASSHSFSVALNPAMCLVLRLCISAFLYNEP